MASAVALIAAIVGVASCSKAPKGADGAEGATTISTGGVEVHAIERGPADAPLTVLFLHGQAYTSRIWAERKILDAVANAGDRAVAVDLPGYGDTPPRPEDEANGAGSVISDGTWLQGLIRAVGDPAHVVVVSPSMSGAYSLTYLRQLPDEPLAGFVPVAPVGIDDFTRPDDAAPIPTESIWGSKDPTYSSTRAQHLVDQMRAGDQARTDVIEGAGHAAYDDHPDEFTALLLAFLRRLNA